MGATTLRQQFAVSASKRVGPAVEMQFKTLPPEEDALKQSIHQLAMNGVSTLFVSAIPYESNVWHRIVLTAELCRKESLKLSLTFFLQEGTTAQSRLHKLGWNHHVADARDLKPELNLEKSAFSKETSEPVARVLAPVTTNLNSLTGGCLDLKRDVTPLSGAWHDFHFNSIPVCPESVNYLDSAIFTDSINTFLLTAQKNLRNNYGTVLEWVCFPIAADGDLLWTDELPRWFTLQARLDLIRHLPVLAGVDVKGVNYSEAIRERYRKGMRKFWLNIFDGNINSLIHEAGLKSVVELGSLPLEPEEIASHFGAVILSSSTNILARDVNRRATGATRTFGSKGVFGRVDLSDSLKMKEQIDSLFVDGAEQIIFSKMDLKLINGENGINPVKDLIAYARRVQLILQNSKPVSDALLCSPYLPSILNRYAYDCVSESALFDAETDDGRIVFASGRAYRYVIADASKFKSAEFREHLRKLSEEGVGSFYLPDNAEVLSEKEKHWLETQKIGEFGRIPNLYGLLSDLSWVSDVDQMDLQFVHRSNQNFDFYLIKNESQSGGVVELIFKTSGFKSVSRWQPLDGRIYEINKFKRVDRYRTTVTTPLRSRELFFMVFER